VCVCVFVCRRAGGGGVGGAPLQQASRDGVGSHLCQAGCPVAACTKLVVKKMKK
jgi:hypothetical protein